jgi:hypothetical protein
MKKLLLLLFVCVTALNVSSRLTEETTTLVVSLTDGTEYRFDIPAKDPTMKFAKGVVNVYCYVAGEEPTTLTIERDQLKNIYFEEKGTAIQTPTISGNAVTFRLLQPGTIAVNGLSAGDEVQVVGIDGRSVMNARAAEGGQAVVDLSSRTRGIYVISVNKRFTFKYMKP